MEEKENPDHRGPYSTFPACYKRMRSRRGSAGRILRLPATTTTNKPVNPNPDPNPNPKRKDTKMKQQLQHSTPLTSSGSGSAPAYVSVPVNYFPRAVAPAHANLMPLPSMEQSFLPPPHHLFPPSFAPAYSNQALMERFRPSHASASSSGVEPVAALVRSDGVVRSPLVSVNPASPAAADQILRWKQKAKERKREIVRLREEIKLLRDGFGCESEPPIASCRCHFFDGCGEVGPPARNGSGDEHWIDSVLRRRFIRLVRWKERRRRVERPLERKNFMEFESEDEIGRLSISIDFLVELSDNVIAKGEVDSSFSTFSHQAIDFILASLKNLLLSRHQREPLEEITNGLIMRLIKRMCTGSQKDNQTDSGSRLDIDSDPQFCVQHLIRKLGKEEFVGQRMMLSLSQKITIVAENLLLLDPFHENFPSLHGSMFLLIQLIEFMITEYITTWLNLEQFDKKLFEEWVRSILKARKDLEILANMNGLYVLYMDRVVALLAKEAGHHGKLDLEVLSKLLS